MNSIKLPAPVDAHVHFRQGEHLPLIVSQTDQKGFEFAVVMPNLIPPVLTADDVNKYRIQIEEHCQKLKPLMTLKLTPKTTPAMLIEASPFVIAAKLYPEGVTTNSGDGFTKAMLNPLSPQLRPILKTMEELDMVLCIHGEMPGAFCMDREERFLNVVEDIARSCSKLRIVLEHITTEKAVSFVNDSHYHHNIAATITLHHLLLTLDDVIGDKINVHNFCKPIPKRNNDLLSLTRSAIGYDQLFQNKYFLGSDSAPHIKGNKECAHGCAGVFSAPVLLEKLAWLFEQNNALATLPNFISHNARQFYRLPEPSWEVELVREPHKVEMVGDFVPFLHGETLKWKIK